MNLITIYLVLLLSFISCEQKSTRFNFINESDIIPEKIIIGINGYSEYLDWPQKKKGNKTINWDKVILNNHDCRIGVTVFLKNGKVIDAGNYQDLTGRPQFESVDFHLLSDSTIVFKNIVYSK